MLCPYSVLEPALLHILNGRIMYEGADPISAMVVVPSSYLNELNYEKYHRYRCAFFFITQGSPRNSKYDFS